MRESVPELSATLDGAGGRFLTPLRFTMGVGWCD